MIFSLTLVLIFLDGLSGDTLTDKDVKPIFAVTTVEEAEGIWSELADKHSPDGVDIWAKIDNQRSDITVKMMEHLYNREMKGKSFVMASTPLLFELAMVCIGAEGDTLNQCIKVLGEGANQPAINAIYHMILKYQLDKKNDGYSLKLLNLIYVDKKFEVEDDCATSFRNIFMSKIRNVSFVTKELANRARVKMMSGVKEYLRYEENGEFQMVALPYKAVKGSSILYFVVYLPKEDKTVAQVLEKVKSNGKFFNTFNKTVNGKIVKNAIVNVTMPEFGITNKVPMEGAFKSLGFTDAFNSKKANFAKLSKTSTYISSFWQELFIQVDPEGTTGGTLDQKESDDVPRGMTDEKEFNAERPFVWMVADVNGNIILNGIYVGDIVPEPSGIMSTMTDVVKRLSTYLPITGRKPAKSVKSK
ncbi:serpin (serine protease inhibitor) domain-containing protein [Ditylenchus destructor]|uniref:Serpin (Serine protease inhibitor) domain-containing protein n=1 Tax=Ditylenchus destructor TaxID=166010 RepID=A0AAD4MNK7_9BILA|nr:serpin (serine protease inhibitor) domain-containing protein [Ditylenchus destructor]